MRSKSENTNTHRQCTRCRNIYDLTAEHFPRAKNRPMGLGYVCRACERLRSRDKNQRIPRRDRWSLMSAEQKDARRIVHNRYMKTAKGRAMMLAKAYLRVDRENGMEGDVTQSFLMNNIFPSACTYCGLSDELMGCDRVDNSKGHLQSNVVPACRTCNCFRSNKFTREEMMELGAVIRGIKLRRIQ